MRAAVRRLRVPATAILGGTPSKGFGQMMKGLETGRIQVAVRRPALEDAQARESFG